MTPFHLELIRLAYAYAGLCRAAHAAKPQHGEGTQRGEWSQFYAAADKAGAAGQALLDWAKGAE